MNRQHAVIATTSNRNHPIAGLAIALAAVRAHGDALVASEIIASVDGPRDADWESTWLAELDQRADAAKTRSERGADWSEARARILNRLVRA